MLETAGGGGLTHTVVPTISVKFGAVSADSFCSLLFHKLYRDTQVFVSVRCSCHFPPALRVVGGRILLLCHA